MTQQFNQGDPVRNTNERSRYYGMTGTFQRTHEKWTFASGLACDVLVAGGYGPYGYDGVIMSVGDLRLVTESEAA